MCVHALWIAGKSTELNGEILGFWYAVEITGAITGYNRFIFRGIVRDRADFGVLTRALCFVSVCCL